MTDVHNKATRYYNMSQIKGGKHQTRTPNFLTMAAQSNVYKKGLHRHLYDFGRLPAGRQGAELFAPGLLFL